ncbi:MAG: membrane protein insertase YidC [Lewinellaceae bacterium]|nr:membrane protein insertase YidC [Phaeodactylibacter sp.]MCB0613377.1 membrane protein insertase YidC [Phaeodactylibacter sp.]MCB9349724.1 membrane protein insertase YidC [Lewinellaceae bacterium]
MDRNTIIGLTLIFILLLAWQQVMQPTEEELQEQQQRQDSIEAVQQRQDSLQEIEKDTTAGLEYVETEADSLKLLRQQVAFGPFSQAAAGTGQEVVLENDLFKLSFSNKGGIIKDALLKNYFKIVDDEEGKDVKVPLSLLEDEKNKFEYFFPIANLPTGGVSSGDLYFEVVKADKQSVTFRAVADNGGYFEQEYRITDGTYNIEYDIKFENLHTLISQNSDEIRLNWVNYLGKLEKNTTYERRYSSVYFKPVDEDPDYCSCTSDDKEEVSGKRVKWVSNANQFFNSSLVAKDAFDGATLETKMLPEDAEDLKLLVSEINVPYQHEASETFAMEFYVGPNEFDRLNALGNDLEDVIPFGWSIFGTINRWVIRPLFNFLSSFIGSKGIVILFLTLIVKLLLYPLTYRMLYSQSKMGALKPRLEGMKEKFKEDPQAQQMETMKLYREFGVNPLGGCMPMVLQMPIWFALYRFFPASIEFRQAGFLWADDLSSYDVFVNLPFELPFHMGAHISLFTVLWAVTTLIYTYYNTRHMDMSANPAMKYMQYIMPVMFLGFFNTFASGLTCYLLFSNLFNITQTIVTKNYIIDNEKIEKELEAYRKKPKKKGGFQQRLETALKEQQRVQEQKETQQQKKRKK